MANEEHVAILKQGIGVWNKWRKKNPDVKADLSQARLSQTDLSDSGLKDVYPSVSDLIKFLLSMVEDYGPDIPGVDLSEADLSEADLSWTNLSGANLRGANLSWADLGNASLFAADLRGADLEKANLRGVNLRAASLENANLSRADLRHSDLNEAKLSMTDWTNVYIGSTTLGSVNLSQVKGLETVSHARSSSVGIDTIYLSGGNIPETFLRGAGVPDNFITFMKSLTGQAFDFYSCFISHSSKDQEFAERLFADLQSSGVRCWYAPHHMEIGAPILNEIDKAIRVHDKLLLILSENSVGSRWVEHEVLSATTKEFQQERDTRTLFPVRLDDAVMDTNVQWARNLKETRHIADFTGWKDHDSYKKAFDRLLQDLTGKS